MTAARPRTALACLVLPLALALPEGADASDPPEVEAPRLAHMLGYVAVDYGGAVSDGVVISQIEFDEQLSMLDDAAALAARVQDARAGEGAAPDIAGEVAALRALVVAKAGVAEVGAAATALRLRVEDLFRLAEAPIGPPDPARGVALYLEHCAPCHGPTGRADTARAATLTPRPADFYDPAKAGALAPARIAGALRFGVGGTAMIPFNFLSDDERWALAFHVAGLRHAAAPPGDPSALPGPAFTIVELAVRSDAHLDADLAARGIPLEGRPALLAALRLRAPYEAAAGVPPLSIARAALAAAAAALQAGDLARARAAAALASRDGLAPAEAAVRALDPALAASLADRAGALRGALDADAPPEATAADLRTLLREATYAEVALATPARAPGSFALARAAAAVTARDAGPPALLAGALAGLAVAPRRQRLARAALGAAGALAGLAALTATLGAASPRLAGDVPPAPALGAALATVALLAALGAGCALALRRARTGPSRTPAAPPPAPGA